MIKIENKIQCCGCQACVNICPKKCIKMKLDKEGFEYPVVDEEKCIHCGLCEKVCHMHGDEIYEMNEPVKQLEFYAAYNKDIETMKKSSSGGIFWLLVQKIIEKKGIVYGAIQDSLYEVKHIRADNLEKAQKMRKSKYLQSHINDTYQMVKEDLRKGKYVLFSGTPCQIAGLYSFLGENQKKLYTCDVVCHGVPSIKVFKQYIECTEKKKKVKVKDICFRDKIHGWGPNYVSLKLENGKKISNVSIENTFQLGFLQNIYLRPSCYSCRYARLPRIGDISLADFWGYNGPLQKNNKNRGLSAIIISTQKGKELFEMIKSNIEYHEVEKEFLTSKSRHVYIHPEVNSQREEFFKDFNNMDFETLTKKYGIYIGIKKKISNHIPIKLRRFILNLKKNRR